jgi:hypothetical protein
MKLAVVMSGHLLRWPETRSDFITKRSKYNPDIYLAMNNVRLKDFAVNRI